MTTERGNAGLEADIGITLGKLTRQLASAEARMVKTAKKFETDFANSNRKVARGFDGMTKSAQDSASVIGREMDQLRAKYDPIFAASKRYEASLDELNRAHKLGALNVQQYERALETLNAEYQRATGASKVMNSGLANVARGSNAMRGQIQNAAFQIGDFAVQVGAGTSASQALGQQLPQLLGGFGVMGAVLGAVVAAGVPLVSFLLNSGEAAETLDEKLDSLKSAVDAYRTAVDAAIVPTDELREKYGQATGAAQEFLQALADINKVEALNALAAVIEDITTKFGSLSDAAILGDADVQATQLEETIRNVGREFDVSGGAAQRLINAMRDLQEAEPGRAQADAARDLLDLMIETIGPIERMEGAALEMARQLAGVALNAGEMQGEFDKAEMSVSDMIAALQTGESTIQAMSRQAATLGDRMWRAASAAWDFARAKEQEIRGTRAYNSTVGRGRGADPRQFGGSAQDIQNYVPSVRLAADQMNQADAARKAAEKAAGAGSKSSGSGKVDAPLFDIGADALDKLQRQIELIGKTEAQVAGLTVKYKLLDEAKKRNLDLDQMQAGTGKTLREEIDAQAQSVEGLAQKYQAAQEQAKFFDDMSTQLKDGLIDAAIEGESFAGVLADVAKALAKAALQAALFNEGPFSSKGGGSGLLGSLFSAGLAAFGGPGMTRGTPLSVPSSGVGSLLPRRLDERAMGGPVAQGQPYLVGEKGPEIMVPSTAGKIIPNNKIGGGGPTSNVTYYIDATGADAAAVQRLEVAMQRNNAEFPGRVISTVRDANRRGALR